MSVRGGREEKTIEKIKAELEKRDWNDYFQEFKVVNDNQKKNILRGYILCRGYLTSEITRFFYQMPEIIGFLNHQRDDAKLPGSVSEVVVKNFLTKIEEKGNQSNNYEEIDLNVNDLVKITEGEFVDQEGRIIELDQKRQKVKIIVKSSGWKISNVPVNICKKVKE